VLMRERRPTGRATADVAVRAAPGPEPSGAKSAAPVSTIHYH